MGLVHLLFGYDTESPYGSQALTEEGVKQREITLNVVYKLNSLFDKYKKSRTFFLLGNFLDATKQVIGEIETRKIFGYNHPLVDLQQHSYSHQPFRKIATRPDKEPMQPNEIEKDVMKASKLIYELFNRDCIGIRAPLGYTNGLEDETEVMNSLLRVGIKYISSDLRDKDWGIEPSLVENGKLRQPYFYYNSLLELPSHGWQDTAFTGKSKTIGVKDYPTNAKEILDYFVNLIEKARFLSQKHNQDIYLGLCLHPQSINVYDPELEFHAKLLEYCEKEKILVSGYTDAYKMISSIQP